MANLPKQPKSGKNSRQRSTKRSWHNHLPAWIKNDAAYQRLSPGVRHTLQEIANTCDTPDDDGNLMGAFGGETLMVKCGGSPSTFWRHVGRLDTCGFIVPINHGGGRLANTWAVPGMKGGLDHQRIRRAKRIQTDDGKIHVDYGATPTRYEPNKNTGPLVSQNETLAPLVSQNDMAPVPK